MDSGFLVFVRNGRVEVQLYDTVDLSASPLVTWAEARGCLAVLVGQLYYREDLQRLLSSEARTSLTDQPTNDAGLVLAAYHRFGEDGFLHLEGDFALLLVDARQRRILGCRDPLGGYPLYWTQQSDSFALSTSLSSLLPFVPRTSLDLEYVAEFLMLPGQVQEVSSERSVYESVQRLAAGSFLAFDYANGVARTQTFWNWCDHLTDPGTDRLEDVAAEYGHLLRAAVRQRMRGSVACHLSGGMDSTSIAAIAHEYVGTGEYREPLQALSLVYERLPGLTTETRYIDAALRGREAILSHRIPADELLDFDAFRDAPRQEEPYAGLRRMALDRATISAAAACGAHTMLTGIGADELLVMSPFYITDLLRSGRLPTAWQEACRWAQVDNCSPWTLLYPYAIANVLPAWMRLGVRAHFRAGYTDWEHQNAWTIAPWIETDFAQKYSLRSRGIENVRRTFHARRPTTLSFALYVIRSRIGDVDRWALGVPAGVTIAHPFLDRRLFCYGLGMQLRLKPQPEHQKPILRHAVSGLLPDEIINRRRKADFSPIYYRGLARNLSYLEDLVQHSDVDELGLISKSTLIRCLRQAAVGSVPKADASHRLNISLAFIQWLSLRQEAQPAHPCPAKSWSFHSHTNSLSLDHEHK
jgi:asparagine synthase (glutamine-hydrolysing)